MGAFVADEVPLRPARITAPVSGSHAARCELAEPFGMSLTGMKKHVHVLENAGLVATEKVGRSRQCRLGTERLEDAMSWITFYQRLWERRLDGLDAYFTLNKEID